MGCPISAKLCAQQALEVHCKWRHWVVDVSRIFKRISCGRWTSGVHQLTKFPSAADRVQLGHPGAVIRTGTVVQQMQPNLVIQPIAPVQGIVVHGQGAMLQSQPVQAQPLQPQLVQAQPLEAVALVGKQAP